MTQLNIPAFLAGKTQWLSGDDNEPSMELFGPVPLPLTVQKNTVTIQWYVWRRGHSPMDPCGSALVFGDLNQEHLLPLVRVHSICITGDVFHSERCDCGEQFNQAVSRITRHGCGILLYLGDQEGRGIGLYRKAMAYALQQAYDLDTVDANLVLGDPADARSYRDAALVLRHLCTRPIVLLTNNPEKETAFASYGIRVMCTKRLLTRVTAHNRQYLNTKATRLGHRFEKEVTI